VTEQAARRSRVGVYGVAVRDDEILLVQLATGFPGAGRWSLPGGGVDWGESLDEALEREFNEETGLSVVRDTFAFNVSYTSDQGEVPIHVQQIVFNVEAGPGIPQVLEVNGSTGQVAWVSLADAATLDLVRISRLAVQSAMGNQAP